jgi:hypothetical protein
MLIRNPGRYRALSLVQVGPVVDTSTSTSTSLLLYPPQVSPDSGGWSFRYCNQSPRTYQRKTPWLFFFGVRVFLQLRTVWLLITNNFTFLLRSRFQQGLFRPVCRFSVALLVVALLYARNGEPWNTVCCASN